MASEQGRSLGSQPRGCAPRRKKFDATLESSLELAARLGALPPGTAVEAQETLHRVTLVSPDCAREALISATYHLSAGRPCRYRV